MRGLDLAQKRVELTGRNTLVPRLQRTAHGIGKTVGMPTGLGRQVYALRPSHTVEFGLPQAFHALTVEFIHKIPLVEHEHDGAARIHSLTHDLQILIGNRLRSIEQYQREFGSFDGGLRAQ